MKTEIDYQWLRQYVEALLWPSSREARARQIEAARRRELMRKGRS
jgi:hypothetical protein